MDEDVAEDRSLGTDDVALETDVVLEIDVVLDDDGWSLEVVVVGAVAEDVLCLLEDDFS